MLLDSLPSFFWKTTHVFKHQKPDPFSTAFSKAMQKKQKRKNAAPGISLFPRKSLMPGCPSVFRSAAPHEQKKPASLTGCESSFFRQRSAPASLLSQFLKKAARLFRTAGAPPIRKIPSAPSAPRSAKRNALKISGNAFR